MKYDPEEYRNNKKISIEIAQLIYLLFSLNTLLRFQIFVPFSWLWQFHQRHLRNAYDVDNTSVWLIQFSFVIYVRRQTNGTDEHLI